MTMKKQLLLSMLFFAALSVPAESVRKMTDGVFTHVGGHKIELRFYNDNIVRVTKTGEVLSWNAQPELSDAPVVVLKPSKLSLDIKEVEGKARISTSGLVVVINLETGAVAVEGKTGD